MSLSWEVLFAVFIVIMVFKKVSYLNFHLKFFLTYSIVIAFATACMPYYLLRPRNVVNLFFSAKVLRVVLPSVAGLKITVRGDEHLRIKQSCVVVSNHQSSIDVIGMFVIWPSLEKLTALAKRELLLVGTFGIAAWLAGVTFINRKAGVKTGQAVNDMMKRLKKRGVKLWVFAEGTRRNTCEIHVFKKGAFHAAIAAQVPILPVVYSSYTSFLDTKNNIFNDGEVIITALPPISTKGLTADDVDDLLQRTRNLMIEKYKETSFEVAKAY